MSIYLTAREIVEGLTQKQVRVALNGFLEAITKLDDNRNVPAFVEDMKRAAKEAERMAMELPA